MSTPPAFSKVWLTMSREAMLQAALDFLDHLGVGLLHVGDALDDLDLLLAGQADEDFAGLLRRADGRGSARSSADARPG